MDPEHLTLFGLKAAGILVLILINGVFVAAEIALVKIRDTQLDVLVSRGQWRARVARQLKNNLNAAISAVQLGITLVNLGLGWEIEPLVQSVLQPTLAYLRIPASTGVHSALFFLSFVSITFLLIIVGEIVPKAVALQATVPVALWIAAPLAWFQRLTYPCIWVINHSAQWLVRRLGARPAGAEGLPTEAELRLLFLASQHAATATPLGREIVLNALELRHRVARQVMRPRREIVALNTEASLAECLELAEKTRYSRFPLCRSGDLDHTLGVIHIKDLYAARASTGSAMDLAGAARKIIYVPETARLERILQFLLERRLHLSLVVDEYGGTLGMVTLENILEELVGQIQDEFDQEKPQVIKTGDGLWELHGALPLHELAELTGEPLEEPDLTTTSGLVTRRLGGFPHEGDTLVLGAYELRVEETDGLRVTRLRLRRR